jgi:hypothetical protein
MSIQDLLNPLHSILQGSIRSEPVREALDIDPQAR